MVLAVKLVLLAMLVFLGGCNTEVLGVNPQDMISGLKFLLVMLLLPADLGLAAVPSEMDFLALLGWWADCFCKADLFLHSITQLFSAPVGIGSFWGRCCADYFLPRNSCSNF